MPLRVIRKPQALADVIEIYHYIAERSPKGAVTTLRKIDAAVQMLANNPDAGRSRTELAPRLRSFPAGRFMIFYVHGAAQLDIVRILHTARDLKPDMFAEDD